MTTFRFLRAGGLLAMLSATALSALLASAPAAAQSSLEQELTPILAGSWRSDANKARDVHRHPRETLAFFGVQPQHTVIELVPGGGWYAEILAPLLATRGQYIGASIDAASGKSDAQAAYYTRTLDGLKAKFGADPARYGKARLTTFNLDKPQLGAPASADVVLTFRNVHNWVEIDAVADVFRAAFAVLKPGGVFGVVDHRAAPGKPLDAVFQSGYLPVEYVIEQARQAGFVLDKSSEVNANPKDTRNHPRGVWTLPPVLALKDTDREKYLAIGESDRFTLRFIKPVK